MKLVMIYGPHAAGKQTIAEEIAKQRDFRVFHNHTFTDGINSVLSGVKTKDELANRLRIEILEKANSENINVIATVGQLSTKRFDYFRGVLELARRIGADFYLVQLTPSVDALLDRVESESRKGVKVDSKELLKNKLSKNPDSFTKFSDIEHLTIDNTNITPAEAAKKIIEHYDL